MKTIPRVIARIVLGCLMLFWLPVSAAIAQVVEDTPTTTPTATVTPTPTATPPVEGTPTPTPTPVLTPMPTPIIEWTATFVGIGDVAAEGRSAQQTRDSGYIAVGSSGSGTHEGGNVYLVKADANGNKVWDTRFGGSDFAWGNCVQEITDDQGTTTTGYVLGGTKLPAGGQPVQIYLVKTDSRGSQVWENTFPRSGLIQSEGNFIRQTRDKGFIVVGNSIPEFSIAASVISLVKTDASGGQQWYKIIGRGDDECWGYCVQELTDDKGTTTTGYIIAGTAVSSGQGKVCLIKTDASGNTNTPGNWVKLFGGDKGEEGRFAQQTKDGGYIVVGLTYSYGDFTDTPNYRYSNIYLLKIDASGDEEWHNAFGRGNYPDEGYSVSQTADKGYVIVGRTYPYGTSDYDIYTIKTDRHGNKQWETILPGSGYSIEPTTDGGYIIAGTTNPPPGSSESSILLSSSGNSRNLYLIKLKGSLMDITGVTPKSWTSYK